MGVKVGTKHSLSFHPFLPLALKLWHSNALAQTPWGLLLAEIGKLVHLDRNLLPRSETGLDGQERTLLSLSPGNTAPGTCRSVHPRPPRRK